MCSIILLHTETERFNVMLVCMILDTPRTFVSVRARDVNIDQASK